MMEYRATINLPECKRGKTAWFDETPRTAILVSRGILIPAIRRLETEFEGEPETLEWDAPPFVMPVIEAVGPAQASQEPLPEAAGDVEPSGAAEADEEAALARYEEAIARGLSEAEAREEGWPTTPVETDV